ncbi:MAG TPA: YetF domain-containing protein [Polyangia bacterium]|jgi:uncharacterized membrane protein YcaP (DUF421 family)|nr:YetF domain-containing protein [Polyangia bacterium]
MRAFDWKGLWSPTWPPWEVALRATLVYLFVVVAFRAVGRKELGRYATHDIVLLFLISTAARQSIVGPDTSLTSAFVALATIIGWDALVSYGTFRSKRLARVIDGPVRQLVKGGAVDDKELENARISRDELVALLRQHGRDDLGDVEHAYLERSGRVTFLLSQKP